MGQPKRVTVHLTEVALEGMARMPARAGLLLLDRIERVRDFPESGSPVTYAGYEHLRQLLVNDWRAVYRYDRDEQTVTILFVQHQRQQWPRQI